MDRYLDMVNREKELKAVEDLGGQLENLSVVGEYTEKVQSAEKTSHGQGESQQDPGAKVEIPFGSKAMSGKEVREMITSQINRELSTMLKVVTRILSLPQIARPDRPPFSPILN